MQPLLNTAALMQSAQIMGNRQCHSGGTPPILLKADDPQTASQDIRAGWTRAHAHAFGPVSWHCRGEGQVQ